MFSEMQFLLFFYLFFFFVCACVCIVPVKLKDTPYKNKRIIWNQYSFFTVQIYLFILLTNIKYNLILIYIFISKWFIWKKWRSHYGKQIWSPVPEGSIDLSSKAMSCGFGTFFFLVLFFNNLDIILFYLWFYPNLRWKHS